MPVSIDIHENTFLEGIYQEGIEKGIETGAHQTARDILLDVLANRFGEITAEMRDRIGSADIKAIRRWNLRAVTGATIEEALS